MSAIASQITSLTIVYSTVYPGADQSKHQSSASLAFVWGIHRRLVNSPHKWPVTRKMFPFDDVIMNHPGLFVNGLQNKGVQTISIYTQLSSKDVLKYCHRLIGKRLLSIFCGHDPGVSWLKSSILARLCATPRWRHQMVTLSVLLALCEGNSTVTGEFPSQRPVAQSFDVSFDLRLNKRLSKQWRRRWFETPLHLLWRYYNDFNDFTWVDFM